MGFWPGEASRGQHCWLQHFRCWRDVSSAASAGKSAHSRLRERQDQLWLPQALYTSGTKHRGSPQNPGQQSHVRWCTQLVTTLDAEFGVAFACFLAAHDCGQSLCLTHITWQQY